MSENNIQLESTASPINNSDTRNSLFAEAYDNLNNSGEYSENQLRNSESDLPPLELLPEHTPMVPEEEGCLKPVPMPKPEFPCDKDIDPDHEIPPRPGDDDIDPGHEIPPRPGDDDIDPWHEIPPRPGDDDIDPCDEIPDRPGDDDIDPDHELPERPGDDDAEPGYEIPERPAEMI